MKFIRFGFFVGMVFATPVASVFAEDTAEICSSFKSLLNLPIGKGLDRAILVTSFPSGDTDEQYFNLDVDGDDISDVVKGGCSPSLMPADPCALLIEMSSGKKINFAFKYDERFYLARYHERIYAIVSPASIIADEKTGAAKAVPRDQIEGHRTIFSVDRHGINPICRKL